MSGLPAGVDAVSLPALLLRLSCVLALAACSAPGPTPVQREPVSALDGNAAVAAVRAAGEALDSAVQVAPLRDPAVDGFMAAAEAAEHAGRIGEAVAEARRAVAMAPEAPEIHQYLAELALLQGDWQAAERQAMHSFEIGPRVGSLCARNWQTLVETRSALSDDAAVATARRHLANCRVAPPVRM